MRICKRCGATKPVGEFALSNRAKDGLHTWCRKCKSAKAREWYQATPERQKARSRRRYAIHGAEMRRRAAEWYGRNKAHANDLQRRWRLRKDFGITLEQYDAWVSAQGGLCAICRRPPRVMSEQRRALRVDHDHETGAIRGLLCHHCNVGIGHFGDSPELLRAAADYTDRAARSRTA